MIARSVNFECSECGQTYTIVAANVEAVTCCPFCGDGALEPYEEGDLEDDFMDEDDPIEDDD